MKITSHYRNKEAELYNGSTIAERHYNGVTIKERRHYSGNEKFYEIDMGFDEPCQLSKLLPKSNLVKLAEKLDSFINSVAQTLKERRR